MMTEDMENQLSDGKNATTEDFARDAKTAMEYLRKEMKFKNVGILGHSEGATIAFMSGSREQFGTVLKSEFHYCHWRTDGSWRLGSNRPKCNNAETR